MTSPLDNPIWNALKSGDAEKNMGADPVAFFGPDIAPFMGMPSWGKENQRQALAQVKGDRRWILLISEEVEFIDEWEIETIIPICQLVLQRPVRGSFITEAGEDIIPLDNRHVEEMMTLTELTRPGPFAARTIEFGNYHGIFQNNQLIAMGGERMHAGAFTEISAICSHPDYQGRGYGAKITGFLSLSVQAKGQVPFLHVRKENERAIKIYKDLGFEIRADMNGYVFNRKGTR